MMRPQEAKKFTSATKKLNESSGRGLRFLEPLLTLSRLIGIHLSTRPDKISYASVIVCCTIFLSLQATALLVLLKNPVFQNSWSVREVGFILSHTLPSAVFCVQLFWFWRNAQFFSTVFSRLVAYKIDGIFLYYPKAWTIIGLGFPPFAVLAEMFVAQRDYVEQVARVLHALGYSASFFPVLNFGSILEVLDARVDQLTRSLKCSSIPSLVALCDEFDDLKNMAWKLSSFFGPTILICFTFFFMDLIWCCYFAVVLLFDGGPDHEIILFVLGAIYSLFVFFLVSKACEDHYKQTKSFHWEMYNQMCSSEHLCRNEKLQLVVSLGKTVEFSCCGFFAIGYPLVTSIIATATTYLVILIQFSIQND